MMNIIEIIDNPDFLKQLFPKGLESFFIGNLIFSCISTQEIEIVIHTNQKPNKEIAKWGKWGKDYNMLSIEVYGGGLRNVKVENWENNKQSYCSCFVSKLDNHFYSIEFKGIDWIIYFESSWLVLQKYKTYLDRG